MSSTGVREENDSNKRIIKGLIQNEAQFIQSLRVFANTSTLSGLGSTEGDSNNSPNEPSGNYLAKSGDVMLGQLGNAFDTLAATNIVNDILDVSKTSGTTFPVVILQGESPPAADDLVTITQGSDVFPFQELVIRTRSSVITVKNSDNINTPDGNDLVLPLGSIIHLYFDTFLGEWIIDGGTPFFGGSGGGSLSEPIELGFNEAVTQTPPTLTIISGDVFNPSHVTLDQDIELDLVISATPSKYKSIFIIFDTPGSGFTVTWPVSVANPPIINDSIAQRISVILYTIDNGTTWTHATSVGSSTGGEFLGPWTANHDAGIKSLVNLAAVAIVDAGGLPRGSISGDAGATAVRLSLATANKFIISDVLTDIVSFDDATGIKLEGSHVFNANNNIINQIKELQFANANAHSPSNELTIAYDIAVGALRYSVPLTTNIHQFFADTDLLASIFRSGVNQGTLSTFTVIASDLVSPENSILQSDGQIFLGDSSTDPTINGQFRRNGADVKVFTGSSLVNLSDVGSPQSSIVDGNTSATVLDSVPSFVVVLDGIQKYSISNTRVDFVDLDLFGINQINMTDPASNPISSLTASASGLLLNIISTSDVYDIKFNSADAFHVDTLRTRILSTTPNTTAPELSLFRDDPSPTLSDIGSILFEGRNSAAQIISYGVIAIGATNVTDTIESGVLVANLYDNGLSVQQLRLVDGELTLRKFSTFGGDDPILNLDHENPSPSFGEHTGIINFRINDSGVFTTYARIQSFAQEITDAGLLKIQVRTDNILLDALVIEGNDNSTQFQFLTSSNGNTRIQPGSPARMAYFVTPQVTDFSLNIGQSGSLQIPQINDGSPSLNDLNAAGGAFDGAIVHDINDGDLYIRATSARWDRYARTGTIV